MVQCNIIKESRKIPVMLYFTLIELMIVISIIVILMSILLPALNNARHTAKRIQCGSNLKNINLVYLNFAADMDNRMVPNAYANTAGHLYYWGRIVSGGAAACGNDSVYMKPSDPVLMCPARDDSRAAVDVTLNNGYDYGVSHFIKGIEDGVWSKMHRVKMPSQSMYAGDANSGWWLNPVNATTSVVYEYGLPRFRHVKYMNVLFIDGHIAQLRSSEVAIGNSMAVFTSFPWNAQAVPDGSGSYNYYIGY